MCYLENKYCYHLFASDIIITDNFEVKLIETNSLPGILKNTKQKKNNPKN